VPHSYVGLTSLKSSITIPDAADDTRLRSVLEAVAETIDGADGANRRFQPYTATLYFRGDGRHLMLPDDLLEVTTLKTDADGDGTYENTWTTPTDYFLEPANAAIHGQPYTEIVTADYAGRYSLHGGQRNIQVTGVWGYKRDLLTLAATLNEALDTTETGVDLTATGELDVLQTILIDTEQMYVTGIAGTTLTVERGVNGTTAAAHNTASVVKLYRYPAPVVEAARLAAAKLFQDPHSPYGVVGSADLGTIQVQRVFDPRVRALLANYRVLVAA
jgi:hypothetical protein